MNIAEFLNTNADKFPRKAAIGFKKRESWKEIHWGDFRRMVFKTANALRKAGISENDKVAIYSDNSAEWIVFDLAILSLGAVTVPIYSTNNQEQAAYILNESECKIILVGNQDQYDASYRILEESLFLTEIIAAKKLIKLQKDRSQHYQNFIKTAAENFQIVAKDNDDLATIIYTSGTTGVPKGVMLTHGNFHKSVEAHFEFFKFKNFENETSLAFLPLTHSQVLGMYPNSVLISGTLHSSKLKKDCNKAFLSNPACLRDSYVCSIDMSTASRIRAIASCSSGGGNAPRSA